MNKFFLLLGIIQLMAFQAFCQQMPIIPHPYHYEYKNGSFKIDSSWSIAAGDGVDSGTVEVFNDFMQNLYGFKFEGSGSGAAKKVGLIRDETLGEGQYRLSAKAGEVSITGSESGLLYGLFSLVQLVEEGKEGALLVPAIEIEDKPEFGYRGLMIDVVRHFRPLDQMKKMVDLMAYFKLNRLHWHLTDDQGWRLEIKKYPKLTEIAAWRDSTIVGPYSKPFVYDGKRHGGFYTQEEARELVAYAAKRHITVIPEIELPGHSSAVLAAYPEFGSFPMENGKPLKGSIPAVDKDGKPLNNEISDAVPGYWGVHYNIYGPKEETFQFLEDVLTEVMGIFPSEYIHIGGDEVPKDHWKTSPIAQEVIEREGLADEHELQSYFITRIERFLNENGRNLIGWDEILEGGLAPNATVMSWRGEEGGIAAAKMGHDVIMTPNSHLYLDHAQGRKSTEPLHFCCYLPLEKVYHYSPRPEALSSEQQQHIMGVQANLWAEYIPSDNKLEYMIFPRLLALSEIAWLGEEQKDFERFSRQSLPVRLQELERMGVHFRIPEAIVTMDRDGEGRHKVRMESRVKGSKIFYTIDGQRADHTALPYEEPFALPHYPKGPQSTRLNYIVVTPDDRSSAMYSLELTAEGPKEIEEE
ncbi:family 20 glycosylhydrolase [Litoribacter ruber]|uniref:beta-N-acetylhexosaminidase n=1 Tax=Litoribacter ruber TaxID=702568 RepID=UPI001BDB3120|nr:family 20 glycosylhydrolase [Litoribacter ruber]MBT0811580.1 family 20 glycosylhydrolase [Litoribacter ruber]